MKTFLICRLNVISLTETIFTANLTFNQDGELLEGRLLPVSGYGNVAPRTEWGKLATIMYAIAGMPLFLLYLSNIGDILAKSFKWTYTKVCLCQGCPGSSAFRKRRRRDMKLAMMRREAYAAGKDWEVTTDLRHRIAPTSQVALIKIYDIYLIAIRKNLLKYFQK